MIARSKTVLRRRSDLHNAAMDSVTTVALVTVAGTVLGTLVGAAGAVRAAGVNNRGQAALEDHKSRRAAYSSCTTALFAWRDAIAELMKGMRSGSLDLEAAKSKLDQVQALRGDVMKTVGTVVVEGPEWPARCAQSAARQLGIWLDGLAFWIARGMPDEMRNDDQWRSLAEDHVETELSLDYFAEACRRVLHPREHQPIRRYIRMRRQRRRG